MLDRTGLFAGPYQMLFTFLMRLLVWTTMIKQPLKHQSTFHMVAINNFLRLMGLRGSDWE